MCSSARPDFNAEEVASVNKNKKELITVLEDMADHLPKENPSKGNTNYFSTSTNNYKTPAMNGLTCHELDRTDWTIRRQRRKCPKLGLEFTCCCFFKR